jgi:hypothetical protein
MIGFMIKYHIAILSKDEWNVLNRGLSEYQYKKIINVDNSILVLNNKLQNMSNLEVYELIEKNIEIEDLFNLQRSYYNIFKLINYYSKKEWEEELSKNMSDKLNNLI